MQRGKKAICIFFSIFILLIFSAVLFFSIFTGLFDIVEKEVFKGANSLGIFKICILIAGIALSALVFVILVKKEEIEKAIKKQEALGEIMITLGSVENIALTVAKGFDGTKNISVKASRQLLDEVEFIIRLQIYAGINIQEVLVRMQDMVKKTVEKYAGIKVKKVKVLVAGIITDDQTVQMGIDKENDIKDELIDKVLKEQPEVDDKWEEERPEKKQ